MRAKSAGHHLASLFLHQDLRTENGGEEGEKMGEVMTPWNIRELSGSRRACHCSAAGRRACAGPAGRGQEHGRDASLTTSRFILPEIFLALREQDELDDSLLKC
jgi:hypothetical protein